MTDLADQKTKEEFAAKPETTGSITGATPMTGAEYLESIDDGREVNIYGERVKNITDHPAFRNTARNLFQIKFSALPKKFPTLEIFLGRRPWPWWKSRAMGMYINSLP